MTDVREQIDFLAGDAIYKGVNLLQSDTLNVVFNAEGEDLEVAGFDGDAGGLSVVSAAAAAWGADGAISCPYSSAAWRDQYCY